MNRYPKPAATPLSEEAKEALNLKRDHAFMEKRYPGWTEQCAAFADRATANPTGPEAQATAIALRYRLAAGLPA